MADFLSTEMSPKTAQKKGRSAIADVVAREYTIHLHKRVCCTDLMPLNFELRRRNARRGGCRVPVEGFYREKQLYMGE